MALEASMFRVDAGSGVPIYRQLVQQVRRDVMLGRLQPGDQLPSVKEVVDSLSVNPNTVVKAFGELEHQGLVLRRQGVGTFVAAAPPVTSLLVAPKLLGSLARWVDRARQDGLSSEQIRMLLEVALDEPAVRVTAARQAVQDEHSATVRRPRAPLRAQDLGPA
jgi:GntR family transcriptional regulator